MYIHKLTIRYKYICIYIYICIHTYLYTYHYLPIIPQKNPQNRFAFLMLRPTLVVENASPPRDATDLVISGMLRRACAERDRTVGRVINARSNKSFGGCGVSAEAPRDTEKIMYF